MTYQINPLAACDSYKLGHREQYPEGTEVVYSNFTPRSTKHFKGSKAYDGKILWIGMQGLVYEMHDMWQKEFFNKPFTIISAWYQDRMAPFMGKSAEEVTVDHIKALHDLGYLPIRIKTLPEGRRVKAGIPVFTVVNTLRPFYWITNYIETYLSAEAWKVPTAATIAFEYKLVLTKAAIRTGAPLDFVNYQAHDFSPRGMSGFHDAARTGIGPLSLFFGTDNISAVDYIMKYYGFNGVILGCSVPATEHSVMCMGGKESELETFKRLVTNIYPVGIASIVSDTWSFWDVVGDETSISAKLKEDILARGKDAFGMSKVVFRPDSGEPADILCGTSQTTPFEIHTGLEVPPGYMGDAFISKDKHFKVVPLHEGGFAYVEAKATSEQKGAVQCLYDLFGGIETSKGFKMVSDRVGLIYGDSITISLTEEIMERFEAKGFASCNTVLGVGSYTYQYVTRDTLGFAMKATYGEIKGQPQEIFKQPKTDPGKNSAKGLLRVEYEKGEYVLYDQQTWEQEAQGELETIYENGRFYSNNIVTWDVVRARVEEELQKVL